MHKRERQRCFVIHSFAEELQDVWDLAIRPAVESVGLDPWDGQEERLGTNLIHKDISFHIWHARLVIADLTTRNPNVMYELGMAHSAKKPVIMLLEDGETPPFNIAHIRYLRYKRSHLKDLRDRLVDRLRSTLSMQPDRHPDFFPELHVLSQEISEEIHYLRSSLVKLDITVYPRSADIFFNDKLVGTGIAKVHVNPRAEKNTVSASTVGFYEFHSQLSEDSVSSGRIDIYLEHVYVEGVDIFERVAKRVPAWLRDRRRDPHNPALMRAVSSYLLLTGEHQDALEEIRELLEVAPGWYLALNQMGFYYGITGRTDDALSWYRQVATICDYHYVGDYNMACVYSLKGELDKALQHLQAIADNERKAQSIRDANHCLSRDADFANLLREVRTKNAFRKIELSLFPDAPGLDESAKLGVQGYVF